MVLKVVRQVVFQGLVKPHGKKLVKGEANAVAAVVVLMVFYVKKKIL